MKRLRLLCFVFSFSFGLPLFGQGPGPGLIEARILYPHLPLAPLRETRQQATETQSFKGSVLGTDLDFELNLTGRTETFATMGTGFSRDTFVIGGASYSLMYERGRARAKKRIVIDKPEFAIRNGRPEVRMKHEEHLVIQDVASADHFGIVIRSRKPILIPLPGEIPLRLIFDAQGIRLVLADKEALRSALASQAAGFFEDAAFAEYFSYELVNVPHQNELQKMIEQQKPNLLSQLRAIVRAQVARAGVVEHFESLLAKLQLPYPGHPGDRAIELVAARESYGWRVHFPGAAGLPEELDRQLRAPAVNHAVVVADGVCLERLVSESLSQTDRRFVLQGLRLWKEEEHQYLELSALVHQADSDATLDPQEISLLMRLELGTDGKAQLVSLNGGPPESAGVSAKLRAALQLAVLRALIRRQLGQASPVLRYRVLSEGLVPPYLAADFAINP